MESDKGSSIKKKECGNTQRTRVFTHLYARSWLCATFRLWASIYSGDWALGIDPTRSPACYTQVFQTCGYHTTNWRVRSYGKSTGFTSSLGLCGQCRTDIHGHTHTCTHTVTNMQTHTHGRTRRHTHILTHADGHEDTHTHTRCFRDFWHLALAQCCTLFFLQPRFMVYLKSNSPFIDH